MRENKNFAKKFRQWRHDYFDEARKRNEQTGQAEAGQPLPEVVEHIGFSELHDDRGGGDNAAPEEVKDQEAPPKVAPKKKRAPAKKKVPRKKG